MAQEAKRGCGFRAVGGLYFVSGALGFVCDRLPYNLSVCSTCGQGLHVTRAPMRVDAEKLFGKHFRMFPTNQTKTYVEDHKVIDAPLVDMKECEEFAVCPFCNPTKMKSAWLMGVGRKYYTPRSFMEEANKLGVSKRIHAVPKEFKLGESWILLTHPDAGTKEFDSHEFKEGIQVNDHLVKCKHCEQTWGDMDSEPTTKCKRKVPAIFTAFRPEKIEILVWKSEATAEKIEELESRGLSVVIIPDGDSDHQSAKHGAQLPKAPKKGEEFNMDAFQKVLE